MDELKDALKRPPWLLEPVNIWRAYKRLSDEKVRGNPAGTLADIVMLVRYAIGEAQALEPLAPLMAGRFNLWLGREAKAGRSYTDKQEELLRLIRDHLAVNIEITPEDLMDAPEFAARVASSTTPAVYSEHGCLRFSTISPTRWWPDVQGW